MESDLAIFFLFRYARLVRIGIMNVGIIIHDGNSGIAGCGVVVGVAVG